ncbi:hypothetical protein A3L09_00670 [Thermococcus profundus]|uniref:Nucleotidyltransferase n=1 Tax=Thermococcus profundus TaxID=49899 RepID=A0A2Z2MD29_THEPR|nr:hypothetical protein [Thermococcus profundus]ASJ01874.1 hypothetical protein A3L09_00670 [Thermococcus profundus]
MPTVFDLIKAQKLKGKIEELIEIVEYVNRDHLPFKIREIHLSGSVLRTSGARDIDITIHAFEVKEVRREWQDFIRDLRENKWKILELVDKYREEMHLKRVNFLDFIYEYADELINLGLKQPWVYNWLPMFRLEDFTNVAVPYDVRDFMPTLIRRRICGQIHCGSLELHVVYYPEGQRPDNEFFLNIPRLPIWSYKKGILEISEETFREYLIKEFQRLIEVSQMILNGNINIFAYMPAKYLMESNKDNFFLTKLFRKAVLGEVENLKGLIESCTKIDPEQTTIKELQDINSKLRKSQKHIEHLGIVWEATVKAWDEVMRGSPVHALWLSEKYGSKTLEELIFRMVSRRVTSSYPRVIKTKDVKKIFNEIGLMSM